MATQPLSRAPGPGRGATPPDQRANTGPLVRWMWIWITLGILVVVTVIGFLIGIVRALESIDDGLVEANNAVQGIGRDAEPLPQHVSVINTSLTDIDKALKPIRGQATEIGSGLELIRNSLQSIDASLKDTSVSLVDTSGSLVDTSGVLVNASDSVAQISGSLVDTSNVLAGVLDTANTIEGTLVQTQRAESLGTRGIWPRVAVANSVLAPAEADTSNINANLVQVNGNLEAICNSPVLALLPPARC